MLGSGQMVNYTTQHIYTLKRKYNVGGNVHQLTKRRLKKLSISVAWTFQHINHTTVNSAEPRLFRWCNGLCSRLPIPDVTNAVDYLVNVTQTGPWSSEHFRTAFISVDLSSTLWGGKSQTALGLTGRERGRERGDFNKQLTVSIKLLVWGKNVNIDPIWN
jgi:hypothetical protein